MALGGAMPAMATFHLWDINEIFTNSDGTIQFIEFTSVDLGQQFLGGETLTTNANNFLFPGDLAGSTANKSFLMATAGFAALTGAVTPDYVIPDGFIATTGGDTITLVDIGIDADVITFGNGILPTDGVTSLNRNMSTGLNSPTNFADEAGSIDVSGPVAPTIDGINDIAILDAGSVSFTASATGDGPFTWAITTPASPPTDMDIDTNTGAFSWTADSASSPVLVVIEATGPGGTDTESFTITVVDALPLGTFATLGTALCLLLLTAFATLRRRKTA